MNPTLNSIISSLQRNGTCINSLIAALTIAGQQLFSSYTFGCPCQVGKNFYYGSAFLVIPTLILLLVGYALRSQTWTITNEYCCKCASRHQKVNPLERKLACLRFFGITGRALVAPLTWLASNLLTGNYYECAASEFTSVDQYPVFDNVSADKREEILAEFPCFTSTESEDMILVRDNIALMHRYQSQMLGWILITLATVAILISRCVARCCTPFTSLQYYYWNNHLQNEQELFQEAAEQHSRFLIRQRIKKLFGFVPGDKEVKHIRIPSCQDWKDMSAPSLLCMGEDFQGHYSFLRDRVDEENEEDKSEGIELKGILYGTRAKADMEKPSTWKWRNYPATGPIVLGPPDAQFSAPTGHWSLAQLPWTPSCEFRERLVTTGQPATTTTTTTTTTT
ncbi:calcium homeostasis modulator protein 4 [Sorex fumeus]|uniref:calcium homeostasis modulator protein 4 n=1 Tax=Sorex fumeus TaxID=62283 RepID=UPI0024AD5B36|nr:calcium homeostasis modulator protein 4 [Sorex fumeus]